MRLKLRLLLISILLTTNISYANEVTPHQFIYIIKRIFPEAKKLSIFISKNKFKQYKDMIIRASMQQQMKSKVYMINNTRDVGNNLREVENDAILLIFDSEILVSQKSKLYILSKSKKKNISIITSMKEYSESGALICINKNEENNIEIIVNLKHNEHLKSKFTEELSQQIGITEIIN